MVGGPGGSVFLLIVFTFTFSGLNTDLLVILLEGSKILSGFGELTFLHTLTDVPMDEGSLGVHKIELVIDPGEHLSDGGGVGDHADSPHDLGDNVTSVHHAAGHVLAVTGVTLGHHGGGLES